MFHSCFVAVSLLFFLQLNPQFCFNVSHHNTAVQLVYVDGPFLLLHSETDAENGAEDTDDGRSYEFEHEIKLVKLLSVAIAPNASSSPKNNSPFILVLLSNNQLVILQVLPDTLKFNSVNTVNLASLLLDKNSHILQIQQSPSNPNHLYFLTDQPSLLFIDNFIIFTRLTESILKDRMETGQLIREFVFKPTSTHCSITDFIVLKESNEVLTVGSDQMITWWTFQEPSTTTSKKPQSSLFSGLFSSNSSTGETNETRQKAPVPLFFLIPSKFLNEPDRHIDRIVGVHQSLVLVEDTKHGRLLFLDSELGIILRILKGYRSCSVYFDKSEGNLRIWAGNRFTLETWNKFPFAKESDIQIQSFPHSTVSFNSDSGSLFRYDIANFQLELYSLNL
jgi:hypothetical protein